MYNLIEYLEYAYNKRIADFISTIFNIFIWNNWFVKIILLTFKILF